LTSTDQNRGNVRVVLDTNIIISALNFSGRERTVLELASKNRFDLCLSPHILREVYGVLTRKFGWSAEMAEQAEALLRSSAIIVNPSVEVTVVEHDDADNSVLACAVDAQASYLVTGDRRHLLPLERHGDVRIVSSFEFLALLAMVDPEQ
jgi:uncharacterized protein